jgi:transposase
MKRIGEDVAEKLDYIPGTFQVEQHVRGKWVCGACETITQKPVAPHVIDKGIPTAGLLAQVLIAKYADHLPLYRQEEIYARSGVPIARSTMAEWVGACGVKLQPLVDALKALLLKRAVLHADETPMPTLRPGLKKTHRSYLWAYGTTAYDPDPIILYDFAVGRSGEHARAFLGDWRGRLVCDDFSGYKALFVGDRPSTEVGCMAHARRKFHALYANHQSQIAGEALEYYGKLYDVERKAKDLGLNAGARAALRRAEAEPVAESLYKWLTNRLAEVAPGSATEKAIKYSLGRWVALTRYLGDGELPIDNNWVENSIRPLALGRKNWLFAGSDRAGRRAAVIMSLIQTARLHGIDPHAYLRDVLERLPLTPASQIGSLLPAAWKLSRPINH